MTPAEIERVFEWYSADLPQNATFQRKIYRWSKFRQDLKDKPSSLFVAFILADSDYSPSIREIVHILLTMPTWSVPCERSFSALRRLKQRNRTAMVEYRLNGLASKLHIHRDVNVDRVKILDKFDTGNRRIDSLHL
jgi:hypothetical protein